MGMFDQMFVKCPKCGKGKVYVQIKCSEGGLDWIDLGKGMVLDSDIGSDSFIWDCNHCKESFQSELKAKTLDLTLMDRKGKMFVIEESIEPNEEEEAEYL